MQYWIGTSGYSYDAWKGLFYPEKTSAKKMLGYYAGKFNTVESNYSFRQVPSAKVIESWRSQTPTSFRFTLKAPMVITHNKRLKNAETATQQFLEAAKSLEGQLGALLFQLRPEMKVDVDCLGNFLALLPREIPSAFEFRNASWFTDEVYALLRAHGCAQCVADTGEGPSTPWVSTADWGYLRLRGDGYSDAQLRKWVKQIRGEKWREVFVYFKHEDTAAGPKLALRLQELTQE